MLDAKPKRRRYFSLRSLLIADAAFELICAVVLAAAAGPVSGWLGIAPFVAYALAAVFALAAVGVGLIARPAHPQLAVAGWLAIANVVGGVAGWTLLSICWSSIDPAGRALLGSAADVFIALGVLQRLALRRLPRD